MSKIEEKPRKYFKLGQEGDVGLMLLIPLTHYEHVRNMIDVLPEATRHEGDEGYFVQFQGAFVDDITVQ